jgi:iron complex outermembrane receptor protein
MLIEKRGWRLLGGGTLLLASSLFLSPAQAQEDATSGDAPIEEITVTGSRIRRDEFSSPSPIQVLDVDSGRQLGITSISEMLQRATVANGQQIDQSLNTNAGNSNATEAPATGGVGSSNIDLRGLGPERTLVMVNGRRMGSVGVRGAPAQPDINMIPFAMVERVEVLTEGVSAVYGADAVAGVVNVIMRDDFEGFEVSATTEIPNDSGGGIGKLSLIAGSQSDRASIIFGAEVATRDRVKTGDRDFSSCYREIEQTEAGQILSTCYQTFFDNVILAPGVVDQNTGLVSGEDWFFYTPGQTNLGIPGYSDWNALPDPQAMNPANGNTNTFRNFGYFDFYNDQDERRRADLVGELNRFSLVTTGKVNLDWWSNEEFFFEAYYLNNQTFSIASTEQIFPDILGSIPQEDANGNIIVDGTGAPVLVPNPLNPLGVDALPILTVESLPQTRDVERQQARFVAGLRGDIGDTSWSYEGYYSYDRGTGFQAQPILFENNLILATQTIRLNAAGEVVCGVPNPTAGFGGFDTPNACVPLDIFGVNSNGATWDGGVYGDGTLSPEETAYLIGNRTNRTVVEQTMVSGFATGDLFSIGDRMIAGAVGAEFRTDAIRSQNDITGVMGFNAAENPLQEGETIGERDVAEVFGEINIPLLDNLAFDAAVRFTDESNFGNETTWRARIAYTPTDSLTLSASAGTSFRAPNLREQFLADQGGGIGGGADPCLATNIDAIDPDSTEGMLLISRCIASGVAFTDESGNGNPDTTVLGTQGVTTIPISTGGKSSLKAETSDSYTATIQFTQPWTDRFDFDIAMSYWSIDIENTVEEPDAGFIINNCFTNDQLPDFANNPFCDLLGRPNTGNPAGNIINFVDVSFINVGKDTAKGIDLNTRMLFSMDSWNTDFSWATATTHQLERDIQPFGPETLFDNVGTIGTPEWKFTSTLSAIVGNFEVLMQNRFIGEGQQLNSDPYVVNARTIFAESLQGIASRDVDSVDSIWYTDLSATYLQDQWSVTLGVNNLFDETPPLINVGEGPNRNNAVSSTGYDFFGRTIFASASFSF